MATLNDRVFDNGLTVLDTEGNRIDVTSQEATSYTEATSTYTLGNSTSLSIGAPADRSGGGREVTVAAISDGSISGTARVGRCCGRRCGRLVCSLDIFVFACLEFGDSSD